MNNIKPGYVLLIIAICALFLGSGILMILLAASLDSYHSLWTVFLDCFALMWPTLCDGCNFTDIHHHDYSNPLENMKDFGFFLAGAFILAGFILPIYLHHIRVLSLAASILSLAGGTLILSAALIFMKYFIIKV